MNVCVTECQWWQSGSANNGMKSDINSAMLDTVKKLISTQNGRAHSTNVKIFNSGSGSG